MNLLGRVWVYAVGFLLAVPALAQTATTPADGMGVVASYDAGGSPVELRRDGAGTVQIDGLPYPGLVLYVPATQTLYYQHPDDPQWIKIGEDQLDAATVPVKLQKGGASAPWQGQDVTAWRLHAGANAQEDMFASVGLARQLGLTAHHLLQVVGMMEWLTAGSAGAPENRMGLTTAQGVDVGLPTRWNTPNGLLTLTALNRAPVATITVPTATQPLTDQLRLTLLLSQFGPDERKAFMTAHAGLPVAVQLDQLQGALQGEYDAQPDQ